jgi:CTP:molybdopterin cytidylyltransferase MocA
VIAGLVLAAGAGHRFGAAKQLAELDGLPLVLHAVEAQLGAGNVERVAVVVGAHREEVSAVLPPDVDVVWCLGWEEGMAASLRAGLAALEGADWVVVTLADQPGITAQIVAMIGDHADADACDAVRATYAGVPGHPVALGRRLLDRAGELTGDAGFRDLLHGARVREVEAGQLGSAADVDVPSDLEALAR